MNEELKIIIKAITDDLEKKLDDIKKELEDVADKGKESGEELDNAFATAGKAALGAVAAIAAITTALVAFGKSTLDSQKALAKLNSSFAAMGASTAQATQTYTDLYAFLGDTDRAVEAASSLALITQNEQELAEWSNILQGAYALMGDKLPTEGLAEAANETIKVGQVTGNMADALNWAGVSEDAFNAALAETTSLEEREALVRETLNGIYSDAADIYGQNNQAMMDYNKSQAALDAALAEAGKYILPLMTQLNNLATTLLTVLKPAIEYIVAIFMVLADWITIAAQVIGSFFGAINTGGKDAATAVSQISSNFNLEEQLKGANDEMKKLKNQASGFDELNVVGSQESGGGGGSSGVDIPAIKIPQIDISAIGTDDFLADLDTAKEKAEGILTLVGLVAGGIAAWKLTNFITDIKAGNKSLSGLMGTIKSIGGYIMIAAGAMLLMSGYSDAWANGIDWGNLATTMGGMVGVIAGITMAYGKLAGKIATATAGISLMVLGVKDFIKNGPTLQNTILIIGGAIAVAVALATAGLSALVAAIVAAVAAVAAFTTAILLEEPAIKTVEEAQELLTEAKNRAVEAENSYINAVDGAEAAMRRLEEAEKAAGITGEELYKQVQEGTLDYADMTDAQKEVYKAYLDNEKKQEELKKSTEELNDAKKAETIASYEHQLALAKESGSYDEFKQSVIKAFEEGALSADEAADLLNQSMSEMSEDAQKTFMEDIPSDIKGGLDPDKYETTRKKIGDWFSGVGKDIKENIWQPIKDWWNEKVKPIFTKEWWANKFSVIKDGAKSAFNSVIQVVEDAINFIIRKINTLSWDIPDWVPVIGGGTFGFDFNEITIPKLAKGGIVDSATVAMFGEAGREAVIPLENNTEWMDILANRIAEKNNTPSKIVLALDGKELGYATINSINNITKQTGTLQLAIM